MVSDYTPPSLPLPSLTLVEDSRSMKTVTDVKGLPPSACSVNCSRKARSAQPSDAYADGLHSPSSSCVPLYRPGPNGGVVVVVVLKGFRERLALSDSDSDVEASVLALK